MFLMKQTKKLKFIAIFNGKVNILLEKKSDFKKISKEERLVAKGGVVVRSRFIGLPLVSDENIGAVFMRRKKTERPFDDFDKEVLSVFSRAGCHCR